MKFYVGYPIAVNSSLACRASGILYLVNHSIVSFDILKNFSHHADFVLVKHFPDNVGTSNEVQHSPVSVCVKNLSVSYLAMIYFPVGLRGANLSVTYLPRCDETKYCVLCFISLLGPNLPASYLTVFDEPKYSGVYFVSSPYKGPIFL